MIKDYLILVPFHNPWTWHTDYANQTAILLSRHNWVIAFLWGDALSLREIVNEKKPFRWLKQVNRRLYLYQPLHFLPFRRFVAIAFLNLLLNLLAVRVLFWWLEWHCRPRQKLLWFFGFFEPLFFLLPKVFRRWFTVYDCVDLTWHPDMGISRFLANEEKKVIKRADIVAVNSHALARLHRRQRPDLVVVPLGFRPEVFRHYPPKIPFHLPAHQPVIGFVGAIDHRLDCRLLTRLTSANPQWLFALVGPIHPTPRDGLTADEIQTLLALPNVIHRVVSPKYVPAVIARFDVAMIPYDTSLPFNRYCFPMKLFEYFYLGKPVVATPIEELKRFPRYVKIGSTAAEWERHIKDLLFRPWPKKDKEEQYSLALANSWERKIEAISQVIEAQSAFAPSIIDLL